jgi:hypothetical protein
MAQQLPLLDSPEREPVREPEWRIDEQTKAIGRKGLALARAALAATAAHDQGHEHDHHRQAA